MQERLFFGLTISFEIFLFLSILMVSNTLVKSAPDAGAGDLFMIHEGIKIKILDYVGSWSKISLEDGKIGWIEKEKFQMI